MRRITSNGRSGSGFGVGVGIDVGEGIDWSPLAPRAAGAGDMAGMCPWGYSDVPNRKVNTLPTLHAPLPERSWTMKTRVVVQLELGG